MPKSHVFFRQGKSIDISISGKFFFFYQGNLDWLVYSVNHAASVVDKSGTLSFGDHWIAGYGQSFPGSWEKSLHLVGFNLISGHY